jgi:prepilin-type N-terminal cleavage/methylation domain-containing protein
MARKSNNNSGFTLMEVTIAVVILAASLVTLLGLQSSIIRLTLRNDERQQAMLLARSILSAMETKLDEVEIQDRTAKGSAILADFNASPPDDMQSNKEQLFDFNVHLVVDTWGIPKIGDDLLKRIRLSIYANNAQEDPFEVLFFVPNQKDNE